MKSARVWTSCGLAALFLLLCLATPLAAKGGGQVHVRGYYRSDGTYVQPHVRSAPDGNPYNNYSFPGNYNPNTNKITTGDPDAYLRRYYSRQSSRSYSTSASAEGSRSVDVIKKGRSGYTRGHASRTPFSSRTAAIQETLKRLGYDPGPVDGVWGPRTELAVMYYQACNGLEVDGVVGQATTESLLLDLKLRTK